MTEKRNKKAWSGLKDERDALERLSQEDPGRHYPGLRDERDALKKEAT